MVLIIGLIINNMCTCKMEDLLGLPIEDECVICGYQHDIKNHFDF
jgi:hypothetical protein